MPLRPQSNIEPQSITIFEFVPCPAILDDVGALPRRRSISRSAGMSFGYFSLCASGVRLLYPWHGGEACIRSFVAVRLRYSMASGTNVNG